MSSITVRAYPPVVKYFALAVSRIGKRLNVCKAIHFLPDSRPSSPLPNSTAPARRRALRCAGNDAVSVNCRPNCRFCQVATLEQAAPWSASALWRPRKVNPGNPESPFRRTCRQEGLRRTQEESRCAANRPSVHAGEHQSSFPGFRGNRSIGCWQTQLERRSRRANPTMCAEQRRVPFGQPSGRYWSFADR